MNIPTIDDRTLQLLRLHYKLLEEGVEPMAIARMGMFIAILEMDAQGATHTQIMKLFKEFLIKFQGATFNKDEFTMDFGKE